MSHTIHKKKRYVFIFIHVVPCMRAYIRLVAGMKNVTQNLHSTLIECQFFAVRRKLCCYVPQRRRRVAAQWDQIAKIRQKNRGIERS